MKHRIKWTCNTPRRVLILLLLGLLVSLVFGNTVMANSDPTLVFLEEEKLSLSPDENGKFIGHVTLQNNGSSVNISGFEASLVDAKGTPVDKAPTISVTLADGENSNKCTAEEPCDMPGYDIAQFQIEVLGVDPKDSLSGYLEIEALDNVSGEGIISEALQLELKAKKEPAKLFGLLNAESVTAGNIIKVSSFVALLTFFASFAGMSIEYKGNFEKEIVFGDLGIITWDTKKNWLVNVTAVQAIALTVVGLALLPETTQFLTKTEKLNEFTALQIMFGLGIAVAPLVGAMLTTIHSHPRQEEASRVYIYVLVVSIIMWSAAGEWLTIIIFFEELRAGDTIVGWPAILLLIILFLILVATFLYTVMKTVNSSVKIIDQQDQELAVIHAMDAIEAALESLSTDSPINIAGQLELPVQPVLNNLKGNEENISIWATLKQLQIELAKCSESLEGKKQACKMLRATYSGLEGVLTALRPQKDGTPQPPSALPSAVTKLCQLFEEAANVPLGDRKTISSSEIRDAVKNLKECVEAEADDTVETLERRLGFEPERTSRARPTPRVYLP